AARVLRYWLPKLSDPMPRLARLVTDDYARVRLEAVVALSYVSDPRAIELAATVVDRPMDKFLSHAFRQTAAALKDRWLPAFERGELAFGNQPERVQAALAAVNSPGAVAPLLKMLKEGKVSDASRPRVLALVASLGTPENMRELLSPALSSVTGQYDRT